MQPTLKPGDIVIADTWFKSNEIKPGDIIVFNHPNINGMHIIKRVSDLVGINSVRVLGDNPKNSLDSRLLGNINLNFVIARAVIKFSDYKISTLKDIN